MLEHCFLELGFGYKIALKEIFAILPMEVHSVRELYLSYYHDKRLYRATKGRKAKSLLLLNNGKAFVSALTPEELNNNILELKRIERGLGIDG